MAWAPAGRKGAPDRVRQVADPPFSNEREKKKKEVNEMGTQLRQDFLIEGKNYGMFDADE